MLRARVAVFIILLLMSGVSLSHAASGKVDCVSRFSELSATPDQTYAKELRDLSPADEVRIRSLINTLEKKGVEREKIIAELRRGAVCDAP